MKYSNIRSRAGLVVLVFALIISLVSAVPIPALSSTLSPRSHGNPSLNGQDIQLDTAGTRALTRRHISTNLNIDDSDQLVRRESIGAKIKHAFQRFGAKVKAGFQKFGSLVKKGFQKAGSAIKKGFQKFGGLVKKGFQKVKQGFQTAGRAIKKGFQKAGAAIKSGFQKVGKGIVTAAKKVWHFVKTTGAKIVKFGLKVYQTVGEAVGKVISFIPGIGKPIQEAIHAATTIAGTISDHIHVKLPPKLEKGMKIMNKADTVMSLIPRRRDFSEEAFQQRDISEAYYFEERDDIALENREESYFEASERDIFERYDLD